MSTCIMKDQRIFQIIFLSFLFVALGQGQINTDQDIQDGDAHHTHQDSSYHCGICDSYLFDSHEVSNINNNELHYHGIGTSESQTPFHCAGCSTHLGYYNDKHDHYQVLNQNVDKKESGKFHCLACQMPLFDQQVKADDSSTYFKQPIAEGRIVLDDRMKFYKVTDSHLTCKSCKGHIGSINRNNTGGFGMRLNLSKVKKKRRK